MRMRRYIKVTPIKGSRRDMAMHYTLEVKKWGYPFLIFKCLRERYSLKWYQWFMYPYICFKLMRGTVND